VTHVAFRWRWSLLAVVATTAILRADAARGQLRIVTYNTATGPRAGMDTILEAIGAELVAGIAKPIDVLVLQEQQSVATTTQQIVGLLNGIYGAGRYARGTVDGRFLGDPDHALRAGVVYDTQSVSLEGEIAFGHLSSSGAARQTLRYQFRPVGYSSSADFYVYSSHYKASTGEQNEARRNVEAKAIRANGDGLGEGAHLIYAGDYNIRSSAEASYQTLLSPGAGRAFDPIDTPGIWHNSSALRFTHTQAPAFNPPEGLVGGGMDDRFDFQLVSGELLDGEGLSYLPGSYHAFGNNGTHACCNRSITSGSGAAPNVLSALATVSDHIPVVADYQLPARMEVALAPLPPRLLVGANQAVEVAVENTAPVVVARGADELDYRVSSSGAVAGSANGTILALTGAAEHTLTFDTKTVGVRAGEVTVTSSSQGVAGGTFVQTVSSTVLDHANGSFDPQHDADLLSLDFGGAAVASGTVSLPVELDALESTAGPTADLDLDTVTGSGDTDILTTDLVPVTGLVAGSSLPGHIVFDPSRVGHFSARYTLDLSDEDLPGAASVAPLTVAVTAIAYRTGDMDIDGDIDFDDIDAFVLGLNDAPAYARTFGLAATMPGDLDGDTDLDFDDVAVFVERLGGIRGGSLPAVPEPAAYTLAVTAILAVWSAGSRRRVPVDRRQPVF